VIPRCIRQKSNQYYFGAKARIGVNSKESVARSVCASAASAHDKHMLPDLLRGEEKKVCHPTDQDLSVGTPVWGVSGYQGQTEAIHEAAPRRGASGAGPSA
jgi:transposase, IS5 family